MRIVAYLREKVQIVLPVPAGVLMCGLESVLRLPIVGGVPALCVQVFILQTRVQLRVVIDDGLEFPLFIL